MGFVLKNSMEKLEKTIRYTALFAIYKSLLSESQKEVINDYFFLDLSISEIADNRGISRSAVDDALSKATSKLDELEDQLKIYEKHKNIAQKLANLKEKALNESEIKEIEEIERELEYGIWSIDW